MTAPKPAPPKKLGGHISSAVVDEVKNLPPIRLESPDGERVIEVKDLDKAKSMVEKGGWKITDKPKTPYAPKEHLTTKPFQESAALAEFYKSMNKPKTVKRNQRKEKN